MIMTEPITREQRAAAVAGLDKLRDELAAASTWLTMRDQDRVAISLETAWHAVGSALWDLEAPLRTSPSRPAGWLNGAAAPRGPS